MDTLNALMQRQSVPVRLLQQPVPDNAELLKILSAAVRVPDHGRLTPWRFILIGPDARSAFADAMISAHLQAEPETTQAQLEKDRTRFGETPMLVVLVCRTEEGRIPIQEQILSAGCVGMSMLQAIHALGFSAQWLTGWAAYDAGVAKLLGLEANESIAGFFHIGTSTEQPLERPRPQAEGLLSRWTPPA